MLSVLVVGSSTPELDDVDRKVIVESPVGETDVVEAGNFEVDECNLVCEVLSDVIPAIVASIVVEVKLGGSNVVAVIVACVSGIAPATGSQT